MFTGIVEEAGRVVAITEKPEGIRLEIETTTAGADARIGDSLAVNGCCLTVVHLRDCPAGKILAFDLLRETWTRTNLHLTRNSSLINLERSLPANGRLHGHFVTGHIDAAGTVEL